MNYQNSLEYLYSLQKTGIKFGLEKISKLLEFLGTPHKKFKSIHIAGTNGKGSTSSFIASILSELNFKVGLYTSPHLVRFNERIKVDGKEIEDEYLVESINLLRSEIEKIKPTFFEVTTAIAFKYFSDLEVDYAVIETGLGGRLDATNVIIPQVSVITKVDYDHQEFLGDTLEKIASEKGGIIKENIPVVIGRNFEEVKKTLEKIAIEKKSKIVFTDENYSSEILKITLDGLNTRIKSNLTDHLYEINSPLVGDYQIENLKNAIAAIEILFPEVNLENIVTSGIAKMKFPLRGRFQIIRHQPLIILDTAHNSDAIRNFLMNLNSLVTSQKFAIFGIMKDKHIDDVINIIGNSFDKIYLCQAKIERSLNVEILSQKFSNFNVQKCNTVKEAIDKALNETSAEAVVTVFGSNFIVGEAIEYLVWKKIYQTS